MRIHMISPLDDLPRRSRLKSYGRMASKALGRGAGRTAAPTPTELLTYNDFSADAPAGTMAKRLAKPQLPLLSFADTQQNVAGFSFVLDPKLGGYAACWALFHLLEYVVTATYNPTRVKISSFLLNNGRAYHIAHAFGTLEFLLEETLLPASFRQYKHLLSITLLGSILILIGQTIRTLAMVTAAQSFTHLVSSTKKDDHVLVTHGIYAWSRHPSYAGFLCWAVGTQIWLGNPVAVVGFSKVLWNFFRARIREEEAFLLRFFGSEYAAYRAQTGTKIPFIR